MFLQSIRFKIILWYMLILALTLALFSALLYRNLSQKLYSSIDDILQSRAEGVVSSIDTYWETERLEAIKQGINSETFNKRYNVNFAKIAQRWVEERSSDPNLLNIIVQLFDVTGARIASSKNMPNIAILPKQIFESVSRGNSLSNTFPVEFSPGKPVTLKAFTLPVIENNKVAYIVQVASPLNSTNLVLKNLRITLFLLLPLTVFLTGIIGVFLARIALRPVDKMINSIHKITAFNLKLKIDVPDTKDEIKRLAETFNEMLARLTQAFSAQQQFIEDFAHELKTPLSILKGELEVALKKMHSTEEHYPIFCSNLEEVNRITCIVQDLLMLARFDSSSITLEAKPLNVGLLIRAIADDIKILAAQKDIRLDCSMQDNLTIYGDENQLKRLFLNLLDNAIKYTPQKGKVTVSLNQEDGLVKVKISDTGVGIQEDELPYIFGRFYRVDKARSEPGFGLGLSIAKSIAQAHRGLIVVESKANQGATFIVTLPLSRP